MSEQETHIQSYKIELRIGYHPGNQEELYRSMWHRLFAWRSVCHRAANMVASVRFSNEKIKDAVYLVDSVKLKLADIAKDPEGMLHTSNQNVGYQVLSGKFKGEVPSSMLSRINNLVHKAYQSERGEIYFGNRSLRSYRNTIPIPVQKKDIYNLHWDQEKERFTFSLYNTPNLHIPFEVNLGKDLQNVKSILDRIIAGHITMCDPSVQIVENKRFNHVIRNAKGEPVLDAKGKMIKDQRKNRIFLILPVNLPVKDTNHIEGKAMECVLDVNDPVKFKIGRKSGSIGNSEEYLHQRKAIQGALQRMQRGLRYAKGGHGRGRKLQKINDFKEKEIRYIENKIHAYSKRIVDLAAQNNCEYIFLIDQEEKEKDAKAEPQDTIIRNWGYYGLIEKITYKAAGHGIKVEKISMEDHKKSDKKTKTKTTA